MKITLQQNKYIYIRASQTIVHTFSNPVVGAGFIPARKSVEIAQSGGHKAHPYI